MIFVKYTTLWTCLNVLDVNRVSGHVVAQGSQFSLKEVEVTVAGNGRRTTPPDLPYSLHGDEGPQESGDSGEGASTG